MSTHTATTKQSHTTRQTTQQTAFNTHTHTHRDAGFTAIIPDKHELA